jgi:hypothetical protein
MWPSPGSEVVIKTDTAQQVPGFGAIVDGNPALFFSSTVSSLMYYQRACDATGSDWSPVCSAPVDSSEIEATWVTSTQFTLQGFTFDLTGLTTPSLTTANLRDLAFLFERLSATQGVLTFDAQSDWAITGGGELLFPRLYFVDWANSVDSVFTFNQEFVLAPGSTHCTQTSSTQLTCSSGGVGSGILQFAGDLNGLSCSSSAASSVLQSLTFTIGKDPEIVPLPSQTSADWTSPTSFSLLGYIYSVADLDSPTGPAAFDLSGAPFAEAPLSATQEMVGFDARSIFTVVGPTLLHPKLYLREWRGTSAQSPAADTDIVFNRPITPLAGLTCCTVSGTVLTCPSSCDLGEGILQVTGDLNGLAVSSTNANQAVSQQMTFSTGEAPATLPSTEICTGTEISQTTSSSYLSSPVFIQTFTTTSTNLLCGFCIEGENSLGLRWEGVIVELRPTTASGEADGDVLLATSDPFDIPQEHSFLCGTFTTAYVPAAAGEVLALVVKTVALKDFSLKKTDSDVYAEGALFTAKSLRDSQTSAGAVDLLFYVTTSAALPAEPAPGSSCPLDRIVQFSFSHTISAVGGGGIPNMLANLMLGTLYFIIVNVWFCSLTRLGGVSADFVGEACLLESNPNVACIYSGSVTLANLADTIFYSFSDHNGVYPLRINSGCSDSSISAPGTTFEYTNLMTFNGDELLLCEANSQSFKGFVAEAVAGTNAPNKLGVMLKIESSAAQCAALKKRENTDHWRYGRMTVTTALSSGPLVGPTSLPTGFLSIAGTGSVGKRSRCFFLFFFKLILQLLLPRLAPRRCLGT